MFLKNDVIPVLVFDGGKLKSKKGVEKLREANREANKKLAKEHL